MAVAAVKEYQFPPADTVDKFHGAQLLYIGWEDHLMFCAPFAFPFPPARLPTRIGKVRSETATPPRYEGWTPASFNAEATVISRLVHWGYALPWLIERPNPCGTPMKHVLRSLISSMRFISFTIEPSP